MKKFLFLAGFGLGGVATLAYMFSDRGIWETAAAMRSLGWTVRPPRNQSQA